MKNRYMRDQSGNAVRTVKVRASIDPTQAAYLPANAVWLRVGFGAIWLTEGGRDRILHAGDTYNPSTVQYGVLVSALRGEPAGIEVWITEQDTETHNRQRLQFLSLSRP